MGLEYLKRWHWALLGILAGVAMGYVWSVNAIEPEPYTMGVDTFLRLLDEKTTLKGERTEEPVLTNIKIGPIEEDYRGKKVQPVMVDELRKLDNKDQWAKFATFQVNAPVPFNLNNKAPDNTIAQFLDAKKKDIPKLSYGTNQAAKPLVNCAIGGVAGLVLLGGIWPTLVNFMAGAGLAPKAAEKDKYDLSRFGSEKEAAGAGKHNLDGADADLAALNARLEAGVGDMNLTDRIEADDAESPVRPAVPPGSVVRPLGPVDPVRPQMPVGHEKPADYKGEFYPVARPAGEQH